MEITKRDAERIRRAFAIMPYASGFRLPKNPSDFTGSEIADNLEILNEKLQYIAQYDAKKDKEMREIESEVKALKSLFARFE